MKIAIDASVSVVADSETCRGGSDFSSYGSLGSNGVSPTGNKQARQVAESGAHNSQSDPATSLPPAALQGAGFSRWRSMLHNKNKMKKIGRIRRSNQDM